MLQTTLQSTVSFCLLRLASKQVDSSTGSRSLKEGWGNPTVVESDGVLVHMMYVLRVTCYVLRVTCYVYIFIYFTYQVLASPEPTVLQMHPAHSLSSQMARRPRTLQQSAHGQDETLRGGRSCRRFATELLQFLLCPSVSQSSLRSDTRLK